MKTITAYECGICGKIYKTQKEVEKCMKKCSNNCEKTTYIYDVNGKDQMEVGFNYNNWDNMLKYSDKYVINADNIALDNDGIDELIKVLKELKKEVVHKKFEKLVDKF